MTPAALQCHIIHVPGHGGPVRTGELTMGNRAVITTEPFSPDKVGIYVHWNGGRESVQAFLDACKELGYRSPGVDPSYAMAQLTKVIGAFFGDGFSLGIGTCKELDCNNYDNGVYLIGGDWEITGRLNHSGSDTVDEEKTEKIKTHLVDLLSEKKAV